jgi:hypothetical protein
VYVIASGVDAKSRTVVIPSGAHAKRARSRGISRRTMGGLVPTALTPRNAFRILPPDSGYRLWGK